jgi:hypothetical protein
MLAIVSRVGSYVQERDRPSTGCFWQNPSRLTPNFRPTSRTCIPGSFTKRRGEILSQTTFYPCWFLARHLMVYSLGSEKRSSWGTAPSNLRSPQEDPVANNGQFTPGRSDSSAGESRPGEASLMDPFSAERPLELRPFPGIATARPAACGPGPRCLCGGCGCCPFQSVPDTSG